MPSTPPPALPIGASEGEAAADGWAGMAQSLELLLIQFLMPDNDARRQAEEQIRRMARDPQVVPALVHHLRTANTPNVRQLAEVLLRKNIISQAPTGPSFHRTPRSPSSKPSSTPSPSTSGEWPELLPFIFQCSQSPQEDHREVALILFSSLAETIWTTFQSHLNDLQPILLKCLQDEASSRVRIAALKANGSFIEYVNDGGGIVKMFRGFVPSILSVSRQCLANGEDDVASIAFEIFDELIESPAPLLGDSVRSIVQFSLEVCSNQDLEINIRQQAIHIISWLPEILSQYESVLPCILNALEDPSDEVKAKSYYALAAFCEDMGEDILPYLEPLMCRLVVSLQVCNWLCSSCFRTGFYAICRKEQEWKQYCLPFIEAAISGFGLDYSELREYTCRVLDWMIVSHRIFLMLHLLHFPPATWMTVLL
ncbi:hypothetical protein GUJ93_ZPchr0013g37856 [Zizania palustris]|uniref:Importin N-terminal domain-containing protein n=1 Tax=Zizania palustris TaxID=103762 RepID=A0A8J6BUF4_ZIZPA|nr:hypothetical protein GUJ93_ZPchr0013g37856 [Zizania palustris]